MDSGCNLNPAWGAKGEGKLRLKQNCKKRLAWKQEDISMLQKNEVRMAAIQSREITDS